MFHPLCCVLSFALAVPPQDPPSAAPQCVGLVRPARSAALSAPPGLVLRSCVEPGTAVEVEGQPARVAALPLEP